MTLTIKELVTLDYILRRVYEESEDEAEKKIIDDLIKKSAADFKNGPG